jgi:hypothetical protein
LAVICPKTTLARYSRGKGGFLINTDLFEAISTGKFYKQALHMH